MNYICPNNCHASDKYGRCPHCDQWLLSSSKSREEIEEMTKQRQEAYRKEVGKRSDVYR